MYKIKRFIDCQVPVNLCNFKCDYCTVGQWDAFKTEYTAFKYPVETMAKALNPERMGGICAINLCGNGETLLHPQIMDFIKLLLKDGHFISIVTNGTVTKAIQALCALEAEQRSRVFIKFSFHYTELLKRKLVDQYFKNIHDAHEAGISFTVELVGSDGNVPYIEEIKAVCMEKLGVLCHLTDPRANTTDDIRHLTEMPMEEHLKVWAPFESALFDYRQETWGDDRKAYFCYGGVWSFNLVLTDGKLKQCYRSSDVIQYIFEDIDEPIHFMPIGHFCRFPHCFNSHVFDCFAGVIPEVNSPTYAALRDRVMPNGEAWLKKPYQEIYSNRVCTNNEVYTEEQQVYTTGLNTLMHTEKAPDERFKAQVKGYLNRLHGQKVAVYGDNKIAAWLCDNFEDVTLYHPNGEADVIIVTDYTHYAQIKTSLKQATCAHIESIVELPTIGC